MYVGFLYNKNAMKKVNNITLAAILVSVASLCSCAASQSSVDTVNPDDETNPGAKIGLKIGDPYKRIEGIGEDVQNGFFDSFETLNPDNWVVGQGYWGLNNGGVSPDNVSITDDGVLALRGNGNYYAKNEVTSYGAYRDGRKCGATLISKFGVAPGHYEIKMKVFPRQGACTAFWTYANRAVPGQVDNENAEIDIELPGGSKSGKITFKKSLNTNWITENAVDSVEYAIKDVDPSADYVAYNDGEWHTFGFDWYTDPECVVYYCDGVITNISNIFIPTLEGRLWVGVWFPNGFTGVANFETDFMYVDYIMYNPFTNQPYNEFDAAPSVAAASDAVYSKDPVAVVPANKVSNGDFEYVGKLPDEDPAELDAAIAARGWEFSKKVSEKAEQKEVAWIEKGIGSADGEGYAAFVKNGGVIRQTIDSVYDGYTYDFSFLGKPDKSNDEGCYMTLNFVGAASDDILGTQKFVINDASDFQKYSARVTAPVGTESIKLEIRSGNGNRVIVDDVKLEMVNK